MVPGAPGINAERIVDAAVGLLDQHGADHLTLRRLAAHLGVTTPVLYFHVGNKAQLWTAVVDRVFGQIELAAPDADWESRVRAFFTNTRAQLLAHPAVLGLAQVQQAPATTRWGSEPFRIMSAAGFDNVSAGRYGLLMLTHVYGFSYVESAMRGASMIEPVIDGAGANRYRLRPEDFAPDAVPITTIDLEGEHELMVDLFLAGLRAALALRAGAG